MIVRISGTGFRVPTIPSEGTGPTDGRPYNTVLVTFGGELPKRVDVLSDQELDVLIDAHDAGAVDVVVQNLDDDGAPIDLEEATATDGFLFVRSRFTAEYESDFARLVRTLLQRLKQQTLAEEVNLTVSVDYDESTGDSLNITKFAKLPGIALIGPELVENRFYSLNGKTDVPIDPEDVDSDFVEVRSPTTVDVRFELVAASNSTAELLNLMSEIVTFFRGNRYLYMLRVKGDPTKGRVRYEMDLESDGYPKVGGVVANQSDLRQFSARFVIRGFDIEELAGFTTDLVTGTLVPRHGVVRDGKVLEEEVSMSPAERVEED